MNSDAFNQLKARIAANPIHFELGNPATEETISKAEQFLGVRFPETYSRFLRTWGTLAIGPLEFYGIAGNDFEKSSVPDGIWFTQAKRKQLGLPTNLIVLLDNNGDEYYSVDTNSGKVVTWEVPTRRVGRELADDVFNFILKESKDWL